MITIALSVVIGYIFGSIPSGLVLVKMVCGIDIREHGSKNIGTTNVFRTVGARMASFVLIADMLKGVAAVLLVRQLFAPGLSVELFTAIASLLGHNYSFLLGFKGGRGVATGLGLILLFMPDVCIFSFTLWLVLVYVTRYVSLGSIVAAFVTPIVAYVRDYPAELVLFALAACAFVIIRHYDNMKRLIAGTETKIKEGSMSNIKNQDKK
ncbi:MAG: glycerol-3-phosphate 1-O-acyltransferase PlsY [Acidaminococcaceae bacterium]|nr:glycerol-3-phosphate 1-O-acyltransferase PlsY [Acidaminococcaceae bacterium]